MAAAVHPVTVMSDRNQALLLIALVLLAGSALFRLAGDSIAPAILVGFVAARGVRAIIVHRRDRRALARILSELRALPRDTREAALTGLKPITLQAYLREVLEKDGSDERDGDVERFPFPGALRRRYATAYWVALVGAAVPLASAAIVPSLETLLRSSLLVAGALALGLAWLVGRQQRALGTVLEISPFRITEVWPEGLRRTLLFNRYLELVNQPRRRRALLRPAGATDAIVIHYSRMGFERLAELVLSYGGFEPAGPGDSAR